MVPVVPATASTIGDRSILEVRGVTKRFGGLQALGGVDLDVREGEIFGLVGPNGSGKTTLINVISGHYPLSSGTIAVDGVAIGSLAAHEIARRGVARTYQIPRPFANMTRARQRRAGRHLRRPAARQRRKSATRRCTGSASPASPARRTCCRPG